VVIAADQVYHGKRFFDAKVIEEGSKQIGRHVVSAALNR